MIPFITATQIRAALPYPALIDALRTIFSQQVEAPQRHVHQLADPAAGASAGPSTLLLMPAWQPTGHLGVKLVTVAAGNAARGLPTVNSVYLLFDTVTGMPLALLDGEELTQRRTAAASALASSCLSRPEAATLLMVGTGRLSAYLLAAHCCVRPMRKVLVWGRSQERALAFVERARHAGLAPDADIMVATDLPAAAGVADIISCATTSTVPIVQGRWLSPGCHVDLVGGFRPDMREADDDLMARSCVFVDTFAGALAEAGDLVQPLASGRLQRSAILAELADLCCARHAGRSTADEITVFKSVGSAIEDLCAAEMVFAAHQLTTV